MKILFDTQEAVVLISYGFLFHYTLNPSIITKVRYEFPREIKDN